MNKLKIDYDMPVPSVDDLNHPLVDRVYELVEQWNANADNHFDMASDIAGFSVVNEELKSDLILKFVHGDIADAIEAMEDFERTHGHPDPDIWTCGRSGSHVWLHLNHRRVLMISYPDPEEIEDLNPVLEWKYMKWVLALIILMLLVKLVNNLLI